jgi:hypothetical protein
VKEFAASTQLDLQRQIKSWEARAVMAEEQLAHLQVRMRMNSADMHMLLVVQLACIPQNTAVTYSSVHVTLSVAVAPCCILRSTFRLWAWRD